MSNEEIVSRIQDGEDLQTELLQQNEKLIDWIAGRYKMYSELDDLKQEAAIALMEAAKCYATDSGITFKTYAINSMRWTLYRYIQNYGSVIRIPAGEKDKARKEGSDNCFLHQMARRAMFVDSLDRQIDGTDELTVADGIAGTADIADGITDTAAASQLSGELWHEVDALEEMQREVICRKYKQGMAIGDIARDIGTDKSTVRYASDKAIRILHRNRRVRHIAEEMGILSSAFHGSYGNFSHTFTSSTEYAAMRLYELQEHI